MTDLLSGSLLVSESFPHESAVLPHMIAQSLKNLIDFTSNESVNLLNAKLKSHSQINGKTHRFAPGANLAIFMC